MGRLACADLRFFSLQLLAQRHKEWSASPCAVLARKSSQAEVLAVSRLAHQRGVRPGLTYAAALGLCPELRADTVGEAELASGVEAARAVLGRFSPAVEPAKGSAGTFWIDASGLELLYPTFLAWGQALHCGLRAAGLSGRVAVGFTRFGTYAVARSGRGAPVQVLGSEEQERKAALAVPLSRLGLPKGVSSGLRQLGLEVLGDLLALPAAGLLERFGAEVHGLRQKAQGELFDPLQAAPQEEPLEERAVLDDPESDSARLTFWIKRLLGPLLLSAAARARALCALELELILDRGGRVREDIRPACPTLDGPQIIDLVRLKLESLALPSGAVEIAVCAKTVPATTEQLLLFPEHQTRDRAAANRALARLRAEFGQDAVLRAHLRSGHLPEARFAFEPVAEVAFPKNPASARPAQVSAKVPRPLVRRLYQRPVPLQSKPVCGPRGCHLLGMDHAPFSRLVGPYIVSGGWWVREAQREYYFAETESGEILWVYFDRRRRRWYAHGEVD